MPEFRQNLATKDWVVIATERRRGPADFRRPAAAAAPAGDCPFCPGGKPGEVRVLPNKYPVLVPGAAPVKDRHALYRSLPGEGLHEVIIDSSDHAATLDGMPAPQARALVGVWHERFKASLANDKVALSVLFKNHGAGSGASIMHPHTQLVSSSVVPSHIRHRMDEASRYYDSAGACVFCRMLETELKDKVRMVEENDHFAAFCLYASLSPFHVWVLPKRHAASFADANPKELDSFAAVLQKLVRRVRAALGDVPYNFVLQSTPLDRGTTEAFHWYLSLVVRVGGGSGFEMGSGIFTNVVVPEEAAAFLQAAKA